MEDEELTQRVAKELRRDIGLIITRLGGCGGSSRERSLAFTKLQEGKMWLGMELGNLGGEDLNLKRDKKELAE